MKKLFSVLTVLLPAVFAVSLLLSAVSGAEDEALLALIGGFLFIGILFPVVFAAITANADKKFLAVSNLWFYATNLLLFASEIILWIIRWNEVRIAEQNGAMEGGLGLVLLILLYLPHWISYLVTRIVGAVSTARVLKDVCDSGTGSVHTLVQLVPVADLLSAILVLRKVNRSLSFQQPPIEIK